MSPKSVLLIGRINKFKRKFSFKNSVKKQLVTQRSSGIKNGLNLVDMVNERWLIYIEPVLEYKKECKNICIPLKYLLTATCEANKVILGGNIMTRMSPHGKPWCGQYSGDNN
jgi:hypothetical protein